MEDALISTQDIPGWAVTSQDDLTVALDMTITDELMQEGLAREFVNRYQNLRKIKQFDVTERNAKLSYVNSNNNAIVDASVNQYYSYICTETGATFINKVEHLESTEEELMEGITVKLDIQK